jgi:UDP-glucose 4-epimerase
MTHYLITGGCGFIGSHIAEALVERGDRVRILDNLSSGYEANLSPIRDRVEFIEGDIRNTADVAGAMDGITHVFHEAALVSVVESVEDPETNHNINITGTLNVLNSARKANVKRIVWASSAAIYGDDPALPKTENMLPSPVSPYGMAKLSGEHYMSVFTACYGIETVSLRYFNVYGPRQDPNSMYAGVIAKFCDVVKSGKSPTIYGDGQQTRDFVFVKDIARANLLAMDADRAGQGETINIATGSRVSLLDLVTVLGELIGKDLEPSFKDVRAGDVNDSVADVSRARDLIGFEAATTLLEGLNALLSA